jgi:hypothetical protein
MKELLRAFLIPVVFPDPYQKDKANCHQILPLARLLDYHMLLESRNCLQVADLLWIKKGRKKNVRTKEKKKRKKRRRWNARNTKKKKKKKRRRRKKRRRNLIAKHLLPRHVSPCKPSTFPRCRALHRPMRRQTLATHHSATW